MEFKIGDAYEVEDYSDVEGEYWPDYWYMCPACGFACNIQVLVDEPPKSYCDCHCGTLMMLCDNLDESD